MKQRRISVLLLAGLLLTSLAGCGAKTTLPAPTEAPATTSSAAAPSEPTPASTPDADAPVETVSAPEMLSAEGTEPPTQASEPPVSESVPSTSEHPEASQSPAPAERPAEPSPVEPEPEPPVEDASEPPATVPTEPTPEPAFDVGYWVDFAKAYAESVGLELDSEAVSCWDNPTIASSASRYLERDLCGLLNKYSRDADITAVWIWAEPRTESSWDIYIGYA